MNNITFDVQELLKRLFKYIFEGLVVAIAAYVIPGKMKLDMVQTLTIGAIAAATFAIMDILNPSIGSSVRNGAGMGIGLNLVGTNIAGGGGFMR